MTSRFILLAALVALGPGCIDTSGLVFGGDGGDGGSGAGTTGGGGEGEGGSTPSGDYAAVVLADGPIGYWPLDSFANELVTEDASGHGWDAYRNMGGATVDARDGQIGMAVALTAQESLFVDGAHPFGFSSGSYTFEAWVRVEGTDVGFGLWTCQANGTGAGYNGYVSTTSISHKRHDEATMSQTHELPVGLVGDFRHLVLVFDGTRVQWFLDGQPGTAPQMADIFWGEHPAPFNLASGGFDAGEAIVVDEVAVYDKVLGEERIEAHYLCGADGQCD